jgi:hypothetical protein
MARPGRWKAIMILRQPRGKEKGAPTESLVIRKMDVRMKFEKCKLRFTSRRPSEGVLFGRQVIQAADRPAYFRPDRSEGHGSPGPRISGQINEHKTSCDDPHSRLIRSPIDVDK